ncbi:MAG: SPFH domain-containing protein [Candidatus Thermoplasmatota archaeon]|nr:SPFH domain-containing protein [Candidatus Thermoplasmatota archaeon]|tara:strand:+ start:1109 stop:2305 length:1197 start_codon:yes stop_codon:yes gene_type:complete
MKIDRLYVLACATLIVLLTLPVAAAAEGDDDGGGVGWLFFGLVILVALAIVVLFAVIRQVEQYETAVRLRLGKYHDMLNPGWNFVIPFLDQAIMVDLRTQVLDVPRQEVITKDNSPTMVDAVIYFRVADGKRAILEVSSYRQAIINMAQTTLRAVIGDMELDQVLSNRDRINHGLRDRLDVETDKWGVKVENVEIREVDPSPNVKQAMEDQTAAERNRRANILRADGEKRAAILNAEGDKQSRILEAEGLRQAQILEAQGQRTARILEQQGEAQGLRIISMGAAAMDSKALTVMSLDTLKQLGAGASTKFVLPFELTKLMEGAAEYVGASRATPDKELSKVGDVEKALGKADDILGPIPTAEEMAKEMNAIKEEVAAAAVHSAASTAEPEELDALPEA